MYGLYKLVRFIMARWKATKTLRAIAAATSDHLGLSTESSGTGNIVNINIKTSNESIAMNPEAIPLNDMGNTFVKENTPELRRSRRLKTPKSYF
jgi:hypothetical protein